MTAPLIFAPDDDNRHPFIADMLQAEGLFFFAWADSTDFGAAPLIVCLAGRYDLTAATRLRDYVVAGGVVVSFSQCEVLLAQFGLAAGDDVEHASVVMRDDVLPGIPARDDLFCPGAISRRLSGGKELLKLRSELNFDLGPAILEKAVGQGRVVAFAYDPVRAVINLRHGLDDFDAKPATRHLRGPRHIHAIIGIAGRYSQQVPIADLHLDLLRTILLAQLPATPLPRVWHLPAAASSIYFLKADGCGEEGIDEEIALAETYAAPVTFYRNLPSRYSGQTLRGWQARGHGIGIELDLNALTYGRTMAELVDADPAIARRIAEFVADFDREFGLPAASVCIHSCQWTGARMVRLLQAQGWQLAAHFCGHDPRRNRHNYGLYCISSTLPMRYYDPQAGVMDFYLQPSQGDESQSVGWVSPEAPPQALRLGFTVAEYARLLVQALAENDAYYHGVHVGNWHPIYLTEQIKRTARAAYYTRAAFVEVMQSLVEHGILRWQLEAWTRFVVARSRLRLTLQSSQPGRTIMTLESPERIDQLTLLLENFSASGTATVDGRRLTIQQTRLEQRRQPYVIVDLTAGSQLELILTSPVAG